MYREGLKVCVHEDSKFPTLSHTSRLENRWVIPDPRTSWKRLTSETPRITPLSCPHQVTSYKPHVLSRALSYLFQFPAPFVFLLVLSPNIILKWPQTFRKGDRKSKCLLCALHLHCSSFAFFPVHALSHHPSLFTHLSPWMALMPRAPPFIFLLFSELFWKDHTCVLMYLSPYSKSKDFYNHNLRTQTRTVSLKNC